MRNLWLSDNGVRQRPQEDDAKEHAGYSDSTGLAPYLEAQVSVYQSSEQLRSRGPTQDQMA